MARSYFPPGFRFHPTDEELLVHYLKRKVAGWKVSEGVIGEIELYKFEPSDLPGLAALQSRDPEWFFFNAQDKKYPHGGRSNRTTKAGYWKATGKDRKIIAGSCTGMKKTLIYYFGRAPHGVRTDWVMHEYRLDEDLEKRMNSTNSFVLCRVRKKGGLGPRNGEQYGAPVLEGIEESDGSITTSFAVEGKVLSPSAEARTGECEILEVPSVTVDEGAGAEGYTDSLLKALTSCKDQEQQPFQEEVLSLGEFSALEVNLSDFAMMEPVLEVPSHYMELWFGDEDKFRDPFLEADQESTMLEEMLHLASGQVGTPRGCSNGVAVQEPSDSQALDDVQGGDFIELADLEENCEEQGTLACGDIEEYFYGMDNGVEIPMSTRVSRNWPQVQSSQSHGYEQDRSGLQHLEACGMVNEHLAAEVRLDSTRVRRVLDLIGTRLLTADDGGDFSDDFSSGLDLTSNEDWGSTANSYSHLRSTDTSTEGQLPGVSLNPGGIVDMQGGACSLASVSQQEGTRPAFEQCGSIIRNTRQVEAIEQLKFTSDPPNNDFERDFTEKSAPPNQSIPSPVRRVVSQILCMFESSPAIAGESERCQPLWRESSKYFAPESKAAQSDFKHVGCLNINGTTSYLKVKSVDVQRTRRKPEMELEWSISPTVSTKRLSFTNGIPIFLLNLASLAVIMFYMFRSFCRLTRTAFLWHREFSTLF